VVNRQSYFEKKRAKRLPAYRRLQAQLAETLLQVERLRLLCVTQQMFQTMLESQIVSARAAMRDVLAMLDASSFGGYKTYRCLTAFEAARLEEIRKLVKP